MLSSRTVPGFTGTFAAVARSSFSNVRSIIGRDGVSPTYVLLRRNGATAPATYSASNVAGSNPTGHVPRDVSCCMTATNLLRWAAPRATFQTVTCAASIPVYGAAQLPGRKLDIARLCSHPIARPTWAAPGPNQQAQSGCRELGLANRTVFLASRPQRRSGE